MEVNRQRKEEILVKVSDIIVRKGLKATTMDSVAAALGISKRTLYEIFDSKDRLIHETVDFMSKYQKKVFKEIYDSSANLMEAIIRIFAYQKKIITNISVEFFKDMDEMYAEIREDYNKEAQSRNLEFLKMMKIGVAENVFRNDVDFRITQILTNVQFESLKRMEQIFPPDITLEKAMEAIIVSTLRSIASSKGMKLLDEALAMGFFDDTSSQDIIPHKPYTPVDDNHSCLKQTPENK